MIEVLSFGFGVAGLVLVRLLAVGQLDSRRKFRQRPRRRSGVHGGRGRVPRLWRKAACAERGEQSDGGGDWIRVSGQGKISGN